MRSSREILMNCKKVQFSGEIQTWETGIDKGPKIFNLNFCAKNNIIFITCLNFQTKNTIFIFRFLDRNKRSSLRSHKWKDQKWMFNYLKMQTEIWSRGEGKFPTLVEVCEGESIKRRVRARGERELFFYEFTMSEILLWIDF